MVNSGLNLADSSLNIGLHWVTCTECDPCFARIRTVTGRNRPMSGQNWSMLASTTVRRPLKGVQVQRIQIPPDFSAHPARMLMALPLIRRSSLILLRVVVVLPTLLLGLLSFFIARFALVLPKLLEPPLLEHLFLSYFESPWYSQFGWRSRCSASSFFSWLQS